MNKTELLLSTLDYYTEDITRRCVTMSPTGFVDACSYHPRNSDKEDVSDGCAIGRFLSEDSKLALDVAGDNLSIFQILMRTEYKALHQHIPQWMHDLGADFLSDVQSVHDTGSYWDDNGITADGKKRIGLLIQRHELKKEDFAKYLA